MPLFLLGLLIGVAGTIIVPRVLGPRLPAALRTGTLLEGRVLAKLAEGERLLLKVQTGEDVYLATFEQRQEEIDLLVDQGDLVTLQVQGADPFPVGPTIRRVRKLDPSAAPSTLEAPDFPAPGAIRESLEGEPASGPEPDAPGDSAPAVQPDSVESEP